MKFFGCIITLNNSFIVYSNFKNLPERQDMAAGPLVEKINENAIQLYRKYNKYLLKILLHVL